MKLKSKLLYSSLIIPVISSPIFIACKYGDEKKDETPKLLNDSQLSTIHNQFSFKLSEEGRKKYLEEGEISLSFFIEEIEKLNSKYNNNHYDDGDKIANDPEFKKYFSLYKPDITKVSKSHRIDIRFKGDETTKQVILFYDVICFDLAVNERLNVRVPIELD
ncbi:hypothetical protein [Metamycoplasma gateae]|uniref:Lipoprotein n=1 Tax=Metamycoplasma gateae TaxID=35769 RepID=A0ABZ2AMG5_9BACT|nr:hypothetical protein V2E26_02795 [Metamycoplasma gateae]